MAITHQLSATTPDDPNYEIRPSHWNDAHAQALTLTGNTAGASTISGTNIVFSAGPNVTLSVNGVSLVFSGGAGAAGNTGYLSGGTTYASLGTVSFANSNGLSFGVNGQTITGSYTVPSTAGLLSAVNVSAGTTSNNLSALTFANANGLTFGIDASTVTASHNALTSQSNQNVTAANGGFAFQTLSFSNANGVSFGTSAGSAITGSVAAQTNQTAGIYAVGNTTGQSSSSTYDARTLSVDGGGIVSAGWSNGSLRVSATQSNQAFSAAGGSSAFQTLSFNNANGVSFSNNAGAVEASIVTTRPVVSNAIQAVGSATGSGTNTSRFAADDHVHEGIFSVGVSNDAGNTVGDTRVGPGRYVFRGGPNITLSQITAANALNTIVVSGGAGAAGNTGYLSAGTTNASLGTVTFGNANGVSFGIDGQTLTASVATSLTNIRVSAGTTSNLLSAVTFANGNGVSFGLDASTVTASVATSLTNIRLSAGTTSNLASAFTFGDANGVSFGLNAGTITGSHNALTSQSNQNVTAANGGFAFQTLSFSNANGVSFGTSAGSAITGSVAAQTNQTVGVYHVGNTTGQSSSSTADARSISIDGAGIVSAGWSAGSIRISATQSNQAFSADASSTFQTLSFQNSNNISFSNNAGAIRLTHNLAGTSTGFAGANISGSMTLNSSGLNLSLSVAAPGAAAENNWFTLAGDNTAGNTTASGSSIMLSVQGPLTISGTNASQIKISAPATSSLSATGEVSISTNGSTISIGAGKTLSYFENIPGRSNINIPWNNATFSRRLIFQPFQLNDYLNGASSIRITIQRSSGTSLNGTLGAGIYTQANGTSLNLVSSTSMAVSLTTSAQYSGNRIIDITGLGALSLTPGQYVLGLWASYAATNDWFVRLLGGDGPNMAGFIFAGTNSTAATASNSMIHPWCGVWNATTGGIPSAVASSSISGGDVANAGVAYQYNFAILGI